MTFSQSQTQQDTRGTGPEAELQKLISSQQQDMRQGHRQYKEENTVSLTGMEPFLSNEGLRPLPRHMQREVSCPYHGSARMIRYANCWGYRCKDCDNERSKRRNRRPDVKAINRERTKQWKKENPEWVRAYSREWKRRKYHEGKG